MLDRGCKLAHQVGKASNPREWIYATFFSLLTMKGDFSRSTFELMGGRSGVLLQQGPVQLDADWSEKTDLRLRESSIFVQVWERRVEAAQDSMEGETALSGPDTSPRPRSRAGEKQEVRLTRLTRDGRNDGLITVKVGKGSHRNGKRSSFALPRMQIRVGARVWKRVATLASAGPRDRVYVLKEENGQTTVQFGDGERGAQVPSGSSVTVGYRFGAGHRGSP